MGRLHKMAPAMAEGQPAVAGTAGTAGLTALLFGAAGCCTTLWGVMSHGLQGSTSAVAAACGGASSCWVTSQAYQARAQLTAASVTACIAVLYNWQ